MDLYGYFKLDKSSYVSVNVFKTLYDSLSNNPFALKIFQNKINPTTFLFCNNISSNVIFSNVINSSISINATQSYTSQYFRIKALYNESCFDNKQLSIIELILSK